MPDAKISDLPDGSPPQDTDEYVIARAGSNFSLSYGDMTAGASSSLSGVGAVTVATNGNTISIGAPAQSVQTQNLVALTLDGNTAGALALASSGTVTLAGGNNITLSQAGNAITISGANAGGAQTGISGIANSETTYTSGTVSLSELGAITIRSTTGNQFQFSVNPQSTQVETQTFIAGISASDTLYTSGNVRITGVGGGVTVSSNTGQRIDISVAAQSVQPETQTFIAGISASDTLYTSGNVRFTGVGGGITVSSNTGQRVDLSVAAQTNQAGSVYAISNTSGTSSGTYDARTLSIAGAGMVTVAASNSGWRINATQSVQPETQTFLGGIQNSQTTYTSGTVNLSVVAGNLTIRSTTGQAFQFSMSQSPETQTAISGIANSQTTYTSGTVSLSELGAITIRSTTGNQYQLSVNAQTTQTQGILSAGVSTGGNTAGNTTVNTGSRFVLVASGNATASQATAAGASTVTISVGTQTVQTQGVLSVGVSTGGNTLGNTTVNTGSRFIIVGSNGITASQGTAAGATTVTLSGVTQSVQTQGILNVALSNVGNTAGDTGINSGTRMVLAGGNNITLSASSAANATTITISGPNTAAQTNQSGNVYAISNTSGTSSGTYDARTLSIAGAGLVTVAASNSGWRVDASNQNLSVGASNVGNTAGNTTVNTGSRLVFAGGNNITVSQGTAAGATTITISAPNLGAGAFSGGASNLGNTAGDTGITGTRLILVGSDNITLSQATDANGGTLSFIGGGGGGFSAGVSTGGNTAGDTGITGTRMVFVGNSPMSLSQATAAAGGTISINAPATSSLSATGLVSISTNGSTISIGAPRAEIDFWDNVVPGASTNFVLPNATLHVYPLNPANAAFPAYMSVSSVFFDVSGTVSTAAAFTRSVSLGIYTRVNSTQLSLSASASTSWGSGAGNMNFADSFAGRRWVTVHSSQFNNAPNFAEGSDYFLAIWDRSSGGSQTFTYQGMLLPYYTGIRSGIMGAVSATNTTFGQYPFLGNYSASFTTAMPNALAASDVNKSNATAISLPRIVFNNVATNII